jgi:hypothetical protein
MELGPRMPISDYSLIELTPEFDRGSNVIATRSSAVGVRTGFAAIPNDGAVGISLYNSADENNYGLVDLLIHPGMKDTLLLTGRNVGTGIKPVTLQSLLALDVPSVKIGNGTLSWNTTEDCLDISQLDGTICQVGLENYIRVINHTTGTLTNGTLVAFSGVNGNYTPTCQPYIADGTMPPLYMIGVLTEDVTDSTTGRATTLGRVHELNTTGSAVSETWAVGDLLWAHPTQAGKLTKVQPTAPDVITSVAAVLKVGVTDGILLVRPTFFPRLYYGVFSSTVNQTAAATSTPYAMTYNTTEIASGFSVVNNSRVTAINAGLYNFQFMAQLKSDTNGGANIWIWARISGTDVPHSATKVTVTDKTVDHYAAWNFVLSLSAGQYFELMWAVDNTTVALVAPAATAFCPSTPSVTLSVTQVNL